jgi:hypothetical protein
LDLVGVRHGIRGYVCSFVMAAGERSAAFSKPAPTSNPVRCGILHDRDTQLRATEIE